MCVCGGGGGDGEVKVGMDFGTDMNPEVQRPTQFIYIGSANRGPNHIFI